MQAKNALLNIGATLKYFRRTFDGVLKNLHRNGIGATKKQAEVISPEIEGQLWAEGCLGDDDPQKLMNTMVFCLGLNLALCSGQEHRRLSPEMFTINQGNDESNTCLVYSEFSFKNNGGCLKDRKVSNKTVKMFANVDNPDKCHSSIYKLLRNLNWKTINRM